MSNYVFAMDGVLCTPCDDFMEAHNCKPIVNAIEFLNWLVKEGHHITIWCERTNELSWVMATREWCSKYGVLYNRLLFDKPKMPTFVNETPCNASDYNYDNDVGEVALLFEEWKKCQNTKE